MRTSCSSRVGVQVAEVQVVAQEAVAAADLVEDRAMGVLDLGPDQARVQELEVSYFNILTLGAGLAVLNSAMACFYTGRGKTWTVMLVHMGGAAVNIPLDYCLINGVGPFPELGIYGAGIATVAAYVWIDLLLAAKKVGSKGRVIGVDMTPEMIEKARENARTVRDQLSDDLWEELNALYLFVRSSAARQQMQDRIGRPPAGYKRGYDVYSHPPDSIATTLVGRTDRRGRVTVPPAATKSSRMPNQRSFSASR